MSFKRCSIICLIILVLLCVCVESKAKKWRAHIKKKTNSPKISATFRTVPPKRKIIHKHKSASASLKRHPNTNFYHPLPSAWPSHTLPATYYLASSYPRWRSYITTPTKTTTTLRKFDLTTPYLSSSSTVPFGTPLRRSDEFEVNHNTPSLMDMNSFNAAMADGLFDPQLSENREFITPPDISLGGWTPIDYKSFMADAELSLLNDQVALSRRLNGDGLVLHDPFEQHYIL